MKISDLIHAFYRAVGYRKEVQEIKEYHFKTWKFELQFVSGETVHIYFSEKFSQVPLQHYSAERVGYLGFKKLLWPPYNGKFGDYAEKN